MMGNPVSFICAATAHGMMILPLHDYSKPDDSKGFVAGVGGMLLRDGIYGEETLANIKAVLSHCKAKHGNGVVMIDGGANIGCFTLSAARFMAGWGSVLAFEPQHRIFMALCGNLVMNNIENVQAYPVALGDVNGTIEFPVPNYHHYGNFGGVSAINPLQGTFGQEVGTTAPVAVKCIDLFQLERLDFLKLDVEGMELLALHGALKTLHLCRPIVMAEHMVCGAKPLEQFFSELGYSSVMVGGDLFAAPKHNEIIEQFIALKQKAEAA